jgi:predicted DNA-binding transcriptional regulator AlpA
MNSLRLLRPTEVEHRTGLKHSRLYADIAAGTWPPYVKRGPRISVLPEHELDAMLVAIIGGATPDDLRQLVKQLVARRKVIVQAGTS